MSGLLLRAVGGAVVAAVASRSGGYGFHLEAARELQEAKCGLVNCCFTIRNTLREDKLENKFGDEDKEKIAVAVKDTLDWVDQPQFAIRECEGFGLQ